MKTEAELAAEATALADESRYREERARLDARKKCDEALKPGLILGELMDTCFNLLVNGGKSHEVENLKEDFQRYTEGNQASRNNHEAG